MDVLLRRPGPNDRRYVIEVTIPWRSWEKDANKSGRRDAFLRLAGVARHKMHIRVLLSKYCAYTPCNACEGARLKLLDQFPPWSKSQCGCGFADGEAIFATSLQVCAQQLEASVWPHHSRPDAVAD